MNLTQKIKDDPALAGFDPKDLPEAAFYRLAVTGDLDSAPTPAQVYTGGYESCDPWKYLVFSDGSLYYENNSQDEVWADARDFVVERLLKRRLPEDYAPDSAEFRLIRDYAGNLID